jgi:uncharacterized membrane protein YsdA (DUF1294 family)
MVMELLVGWLGVVVLASLLSLVMYRVDKQRAGQGHQRIPERTLHLIDVVGGWPGGWYARRTYRHKTQKLSFRIVFGLTVVVHAALSLALFGWWFLPR